MSNLVAVHYVRFYQVCTSVSNFNTVWQCVDDRVIGELICWFTGPFFTGAGQLFSLLFQTWGGHNRTVIGASTARFRFQFPTRCSAQQRPRPNRGQILHFLTPVKFRGRVGEMFEWTLRVRPRTKPLMILYSGPSGRLKVGSQKQDRTSV